jgi:hypothetical protein
MISCKKKKKNIILPSGHNMISCFKKNVISAGGCEAISPKIIIWQLGNNVMQKK